MPEKQEYFTLGEWAILLIVVIVTIVAALMVLPPECGGCQGGWRINPLLACLDPAGRTPTPSCIAIHTSVAATATAQFAATATAKASIPAWWPFGH